jgi:hypothetical protein
VFPANKLNEVAEIEDDLAEYLQERQGGACSFCEQAPSVWLSNHVSIFALDTSEHGNLPVDEMPMATIRRKKLYHQMAITINGAGVLLYGKRCPH